ncbi:MAG: DUF4261 domain-containing protein [Deltaproteobacteria bacterium]|nr:DUF4261 domain-containing protein [Deltaproteobacteria bacterium]
MKGMFMQGLAVLLRERPSLDDIEQALSGFDIVKRVEPGEFSWMSGLFGVVVAMRPQVNGYVVVDVVDRPWPDAMGDPKTDSLLFGAWSMGFFGPLTFPGGMQRAVSHAYGWPGAKAAAEGHRAFVRVRVSYVLGAAAGAPVAPADQDAEGELMFATNVARALSRIPGALAYFNPNGEVLLHPDELHLSMGQARDQDLPPLDAWSNVRMFKVDDAWMMMDTVGLGQLDLEDHEAWFRKGACDPNSVGTWLRNLSVYVQRGGKIADGDTSDGPRGVHWRARRVDESQLSPPRAVIRWAPDDGTKPPW